MDKEYWNNRYKTNESVYGHQPNRFFKEQLLKLKPGKLLLPAEGEGRNALFAASIGWNVIAFDFSVEARNKALAAAALNHLTIDYTIQDFGEIKLPEQTYDAIGIIYVHQQPALRKAFHQQCVKALKSGGVLIFEAFSKEQINNTSGGPKDMSMLHSIETLLEDFEGLHISHGKTEDIFLNEGEFHSGRAAVVRLVATKL
jgi:2-polyprenyl-3-methyl-5-hydroxy-6-metoxy-1,4-benzoquinol methylase